MAPINSHTKLFIIDDDPDIVCAAQLLLRRIVGSIYTLNDPEGLSKLLAEVEPDIVLLDMNFSPGYIDGNEGLALLSRLQQLDNPPTIITMTAYADVPLAVAALKSGATDFITKPWNNEQLVAIIQTAAKRREISLCKSLATNHRHAELIGQSALMQNLRSTINSVGPTNANIMILGENGVGKELVARAIHLVSERANKTFLSVDMGSLPEATLESELFGHKKGAFTGAQQERDGRFQAARGGTLFLDEIGNMSLNAQAKLLTVLEKREVTPLGSDKPSSIDVRIVSATNLDEVKLYSPDIFRSDLLFRLNTIVIRVPTLRDRVEDIPLLLDHYLHHFQQEYQRQPREINVVTLMRLQEYAWPGNVRELRQTCERAVILASGVEYKIENFGILDKQVNKLERTLNTLASSSESLPLDALERKAIVEAMTNARGNVSHASKALGISRPALYRKLEKYGI
jgi:DNA-binding NtrC family response regulator